MPQLRQNIILKEWVVISTERAKRPEELKESHDFCRAELPEHDPKCPFCTGNENKDGIEDIYREEDKNGWKLRLIPNKFPALLPAEQDIHAYTDGCFRWMDGIGHHEVIIESPVHNQTIATMDPSQVYRILNLYQKRYIELNEISYVESIILFRNHGTRAGASLVHPHSQLIGLPVIPRDVMTRVNESIRYYEEHRQCIFCRVLHSELENEERVVLESPHFVAYVPYAAASPFHLWIFPKQHKASFMEASEEELKDLSFVLHAVLRKLYIGLNDPDYNYIIRTAPRGYGHSDFFHWYITIVPRLTRTAGFELGSGMFINPSIPEENAEYLRSIEI